MNIDSEIIKNIDSTTSPRYVRGMSFQLACEYLIRINPIRVFMHDWIDDKLKDTIVRRYISRKIPLKILKSF